MRDTGWFLLRRMDCYPLRYAHFRGFWLEAGVHNSKSGEGVQLSSESFLNHGHG
jgi:hypothetical protein